MEVTILGEPQGREAEGWRTGIALDASSSMQDAYGRRLLGKVPPALLKEYIAKGWVEERQADGRPLRVFQREAYDDAIARGHLKFTPNRGGTLRAGVDRLPGRQSGRARRNGGDLLGLRVGRADRSAGRYQRRTARPRPRFTVRSKPLSAFKPICCPRCVTSPSASPPPGAVCTCSSLMAGSTISTAVTRYSTQLARAIEAGQRHSLKAVLIGLGDKIDPTQMEALDTLDTGTAVDLWDCKYAREMRSLRDIFAEVVSEHQTVAPTATLYDHRGTVVKKYTDGVPARLRVTLPAGCPVFELDVLGRRIRQSLSSLSLHP